MKKIIKVVMILVYMLSCTGCVTSKEDKDDLLSKAKSISYLSIVDDVEGNHASVVDYKGNILAIFAYAHSINDSYVELGCIKIDDQNNKSYHLVNPIIYVHLPQEQLSKLNLKEEIYVVGFVYKAGEEKMYNNDIIELSPAFLLTKDEFEAINN